MSSPAIVQVFLPRPSVEARGSQNLESPARMRKLLNVCVSTRFWRACAFRVLLFHRYMNLNDEITLQNWQSGYCSFGACNLFLLLKMNLFFCCQHNNDRSVLNCEFHF